MPIHQILASVGDPTTRLTSSNISRRIEAIEDFWKSNSHTSKRKCFWNKFIEAKNKYNADTTNTANKEILNKLVCDNRLNDEFFGGDPSYKNCPVQYKKQNTNLCNSTRSSGTSSRGSGSRGRRSVTRVTRSGRSGRGGGSRGRGGGSSGTRSGRRGRRSGSRGRRS